MELLTPSIGLIFWQVIVFLLLLLVLSKFAWKPIVSALETREHFIGDALRSAEEANSQLQQTKQKGNALIEEAYKKRDEILKKAHETAEKIHQKAREDAQKISDKMLSDAAQEIQSEKVLAGESFQHLVAEVAVDVSAKVLREQLSENAAARDLVEKYVKELPQPNF